MWLTDLIFGSSTSKTYKDKRGYPRFKDSKKPVHRSVAEMMLGRKLKKGEVVHHKNRNKSDNTFANLWVFRSQKEHDRVHRIDAKRHGKKASFWGWK